MSQKVKVYDSHTGGEPTRVIIQDVPDLKGNTLAEKRESFALDWNNFRKSVCLEPRGSDALVGALFVKPVREDCEAGVIFFNNVGVLNMCVHGTIGLTATLIHTGYFSEGIHRIETPVGVVTATAHNKAEVSVENVLSYRHQTKVVIDVEGIGEVIGDVAWGGNWFFLVRNCDELGIEVVSSKIKELTDISLKIRQCLEEKGITGTEGGEIDHIELFTSKCTHENSNSKSFVMCPGGAYDRSPCGTGTSAKLACLYADGVLKEGETWRQESVIGSVFEGSYREVNGGIIPCIKGAAYMTAESELLFNEGDPFASGIEL